MAAEEKVDKQRYHEDGQEGVDRDEHDAQRIVPPCQEGPEQEQVDIRRNADENPPGVQVFVVGEEKTRQEENDERVDAVVEKGTEQAFLLVLKRMGYFREIHHHHRRKNHEEEPIGNPPLEGRTEPLMKTADKQSGYREDNNQPGEIDLGLL